jgi:hypothetical protein
VKPGGDCSGLTAQQCAIAQYEKQHSLNSLNDQYTTWQFIVGGTTLLGDVIQLVLDWTAKGAKDIINLIGDGINILGDLSTLFSLAVRDFGWTSLQKAADVAAIISNGLSAAWKAVRLVLGKNMWGMFASAAIGLIAEGVQALFTGGASTLIDALHVVIDSGIDKLRQTIGGIVLLGGSIEQTHLAYLQFQMDECTDAPLAQVYKNGGC